MGDLLKYIFLCSTAKVSHSLCGDGESALLTSSQVMLLLPIWNTLRNTNLDAGSQMWLHIGISGLFCFVFVLLFLKYWPLIGVRYGLGTENVISGSVA